MRVLVIHNEYELHGGEDTVYAQEKAAYSALGYEVKTFLVSNKTLSFFDLLTSLWNPRSYFLVKKLVKTYNPDIIHIHNFIFKLSPSIFWAFNKNAKVYLTIHNYRFLCPSGTLFVNRKVDLSSKTARGLIKNIFKGAYQNSIIKTTILVSIFKINQAIGTFKRIDKFVFLTKFSRDIHLNWNKKFFKNNLVKPNFLSIRLPDNYEIEFDIIFIGRISIEKGLESVLPILAKQKDRRIAIVGDGPNYLSVKENYQKHKHITFFGPQLYKNTLMLLQKSKFLLFPSIWYEVMPMTIIESFAMSKPIVAHNFGAVKSMIAHKHNGLLYETNQQLQFILETLDKFNYQELSHNALVEYETKYAYNVGLNNLSKF